MSIRTTSALLVIVALVTLLVLSWDTQHIVRSEAERQASGESTTSDPAFPPGSIPPRSTVPGFREINALAEAFPGRITEVALRDGQWALFLDGTWYYWAEGRILPDPVREEWNEFVPIRFYNYTLGEWSVPEVSPELEARLASSTENRDNDGRIRFNSFLDDLYGIDSRAVAEQTMEWVTIFNVSARVHPLVVKPLLRVEERIRRAMQDDEETRRYIDNLAAMHGYNWRVIAGTQRRSYHAYGMAVDLTPRSYGGLWAYWRWAADGGVPEWWRLGEDVRWHVPQGVIDAFEAEGFVWGGKWLFFDNVHFEYRPEVILMARLGG